MPGSGTPPAPRGLTLRRARRVGPDPLAPPVTWAVLAAGPRLVWAGPASAAPPELAGRADVGPEALRVSDLLTDHHVHGGAGVDLATSDVAAVHGWLATRRADGVGRVIGSLPALPEADLDAALTRLRPLWEEGALAGVHLEGPFLSPARAGAHHPDALCTADSRAGRAVLEVLAAQPRGLVRTMTLAPELPGTAVLEDALETAGVLPCLGHTDADLPTTQAALARWAGRAGAAGGRTPRPTPVATHLFNAMRGIHHRSPGPVPALLAEARRGTLRLELIADGAHVDPALVDLLLADPGLDGALCLVSDAVAATGAPTGTRHRLGPHTVHAGHDAPRLGTAGDGAEAPLAGGRRTLTDQVAALLRRGTDPDRVLRAATHVPARTLTDDGADGPETPAGVVLWEADGTRTVLLPD